MFNKPIEDHGHLQNKVIKIIRDVLAVLSSYLNGGTVIFLSKESLVNTLYMVRGGKVVNAKDLEEKLATLMDNIPEIEGLFALDGKGKLIIGQTIIEMDKGAIAKAAYSAFTSAREVGSKMGKGGVQSLIMNMDAGSSCVVGNDNVILVSMQGEDASASIALILRSIKSILE